MEEAFVLGCYNCYAPLPNELLLCECQDAAYCSVECHASYILSDAHSDRHTSLIGPPKRQTEGEGESTPAEPKPKRQKGIEKPETKVKREAKAVTAEIKKSLKGELTLVLFRALLADAKSTADALISTFKLLRNPKYYPYVLNNQSSGNQQRLDLRSHEKPVVVSVLSSAQRLGADSFGPWSGVKGALFEWDTGMGKTVEIHTVGKNYRHESVDMPVLVQTGKDDQMVGATESMPRICIIVTEAHLKIDVMKDVWAQDNRNTEWICNQIKAVGLCCNEKASPFTSTHVLTGRQLTNAMMGKGPVGRALWSGLYPDESEQVIPLTDYPRIPTGYRQVNENGLTKWKSHDMQWSEESPQRSSQFDLIIGNPKLSDKSVEAVVHSFENLMGGFPNAPKGQKTWQDNFDGVAIEVGRTERQVKFTVVISWKSKKGIPSESGWRKYLKEYFEPHIKSSWGSVKTIEAKVKRIQPTVASQKYNAEAHGYQLFRKGKKVEWRRRLPGATEVHYNPFRRVVLMIDEADKFFIPDHVGGSVPDLELYHTVIQDCPEMRAFYFTATSDFVVGSGIYRSLIPRKDISPIEIDTPRPAKNVEDIILPNFTPLVKLTFEDIETETGNLLTHSKKGGKSFDKAQLELLKNGIKGLSSVAVANNRDYFADVKRNEPVPYELPLSHATKIYELARSSASRLGPAIIWNPDVVVETKWKLSSSAFDPDDVLNSLVFGSEKASPLLPGAKALLLQLRKNDELASEVINERSKTELTKLYKQAVYSTLRNDATAIDLYAAVLQAVGYNWVRTVRRRINRVGWTYAQRQEEKRQRRAGKVDAQYREVDLKFDFTLPHTKDEVRQTAYGPRFAGLPSAFVVLSESLITDEEIEDQPDTEIALQEKVKKTEEFATGYCFHSTVRKMKDGGMIFGEIPPAKPDQPMAPAYPGPDASRIQQADFVKAREKYEQEMVQYTELLKEYESNLEAYKTREKDFTKYRASLLKHRIFFWPGSHVAVDAKGKEFASRVDPNVAKKFGTQPSPRWFVMRQGKNDEDETGLQPEDLDEMLRMPITLDFIKRVAQFNFYMSDNQQQDLLSAITETYNSNDNGYGMTIRFVQFGGNYLQGFDLKDTPFSTAVHPAVDRRTEIQATGRTNRRNGMPNIPFEERTLRLTTLYAVWPKLAWTFKAPTVGYLTERTQAQEEKEVNDKRTGEMVGELSVVTTIDDDPMSPENLAKSHSLRPTDVLLPYSIWRMQNDDPSVSAIRLEGNAHFRSFAVDASYKTLLADEDDKNQPSDSYSPRWQVGPTMWSLRKRALQTLLDNVKEMAAIMEKTQQATGAVESLEQYEARILKLAMADRGWNLFLNPDEHETPQEKVDREEQNRESNQFVIDRLKRKTPFLSVVQSEDNPAYVALKKRETALKNLLDLFENKDVSELRLFRRLAFERANRFLLLSPDVSPIPAAFMVLNPSWFGLESANTAFLTKLFDINMITWTPKIEKISTEELVEPPLPPSKKPKTTKAELFTVQARFIDACVPDKEAIAAVEIMEPYSNVLEAVSFPDDEQGAIERMQDRDGVFTSNFIFALRLLEFWPKPVAPKILPETEAEQIEEIYRTRGDRVAEELKLAIMELTKFGLLDWRRGLRYICFVFTSPSIPNTTPLISVARFVGMLFFTSAKPGFQPIMELIFDAPRLANRVLLSFEDIYTFVRMLFQWSTAYSPFDKPDYKVAFGQDLISLRQLLSGLQDTLDLDIFSDLKKLRNGFFKQYAANAKNISNRSTPPDDTMVVLTTYVTQLGQHTAKPLVQAAEKWKDLDYNLLIQTFVEEKNLETAKEKVLKLMEEQPQKARGGVGLKRTLWLLDVLQMGADTSALENFELLKEKVGKPIVEFLETLYSMIDLIPPSEGAFGFVKQFFKMLKPVGYLVPELASYLTEQFKDGTKAQMTRQNLIGQMEVWNRYKSTGMVVGTQQLFIEKLEYTTNEELNRLLVLYDTRGVPVPFCLENQLLEKYRTEGESFLFGVAESVLPSKFSEALAIDFRNGVLPDHRFALFKTLTQHPRALPDLIYKRTYSEVLTILAVCVLELNFTPEDWKKIGLFFPRGTHFDPPVLERLKQLLTVFDNGFTPRITAQLLSEYWPQDKQRIEADKILDIILKTQTKKGKGPETFRKKYTSLRELYKAIRVGKNKLIKTMAKAAIASTKPGKGKTPAPPRQQAYQADTTLIWMDIPAKFIGEWRKQFMEKFGPETQQAELEPEVHILTEDPIQYDAKSTCSDLLCSAKGVQSGEDDMDEVLPHVWIGNLDSACELTHIDAIVSVIQSLEDHEERCIGSKSHLLIPIFDGPEAPIERYFETAAVFIESQVKQHHDVLIHCARGHSRSTAMVLYYMLTRLSYKTVDEALKTIREKRPSANPNPGFIAKLKALFS